MRIIYFDICAIAVHLIIIWTCVSRRLTKGRSNRVFLFMTGLSLVCCVLDIAMEFAVNPLPLSRTAVFAGQAISFSYLLLRNGTLVVYLFLIFVITRTEYRLQSKRILAAVLLPYAVLAFLLFQNIVTQNVFSVTAENGYSRESLLLVLYGIAALYGVIGLAYCLYCRAFLPFNKWFSLLSVYLLTFLAVAIQLVWPDLLVEMFSTSAGLLMILLQVMRPEESMDPTLGVHSRNAFREDLNNLLKTKRRVGIIAAQMSNAQELRLYLGDERYEEKIRGWLESFRSRVPQKALSRLDIYFERPGIIYVIMEDTSREAEKGYDALMALLENSADRVSEAEIRIELKLCLIRCPDDLNRFQDIQNLCRRFPSLGEEGRHVFRAAGLMHNRDFELLIHTEEILHRALTQDSLQVYYQPIFDLRRKCFHSAEALSRLVDEKYGMVSPAVFIPAAERSGLIVPLGEKILEAVFRFVSEQDMEALGLDCVEINLSVAQCADKGLYDTVSALMKKYEIAPGLIHFEITESTFDHISRTGRENLKRLSDEGFRYALDDYGTGYSNIQRLGRMEFDIVKIDKSLVDELETVQGGLIMQNTIRMLHDLEKDIVIEGVETEKAVETLTALSGDYIQGFYYSRPLPEEAFVRFLKEKKPR